MLRLHDHITSGNGYKVRLLLTLLGLPFARVEYDVDRGATRTPDFLRLNPNGRVPVLDVEDGRCLAESNAILCYLAEGTRFLPSDRFERALVLQWLFFEQYSHEPHIAMLRYWLSIARTAPPQSRIDAMRAGGFAALQAMDRHLSRSAFLVAERYTIADIALYAYTHVAHEAGFDLSEHPAVSRWLARVAAQPQHIPIDA